MRFWVVKDLIRATWMSLTSKAVFFLSPSVLLRAEDAFLSLSFFSSSPSFLVSVVVSLMESRSFL